MSRRDRSSVGNRCGAGFPKPLQGLDGMCLRVSCVSARSSQLRPRSCRGVRDGAICEGGGHDFFDGYNKEISVVGYFL